MIFLLDTSTPTCRMGLYVSDQKTIFTSWEAHRELADRLLREIDAFLSAQNTEIYSLKGIVVHKGPGSFTGLRIGITVANTLAHSLKIPIVGVGEEKWQQEGIEMLTRHEDHRIVLPEYGSPPHITKPKK